MAKTTCEIEIHAPPEVVYAVLWDVGRYPEFMSDCIDAVALRDEQGGGFTSQQAEMRIQLIRPLHYRIAMTGEPPARIGWETIEADAYLATHEGAWHIEASEDRRGCNVRYDLHVEFRLPIPDAVIRRFAELNLPTMLRQVKARAEQVARKAEHGI